MKIPPRRYSPLQRKLLSLRIGDEATFKLSGYLSHPGALLKQARIRHQRNYALVEKTKRAFRVRYEGPLLAFPPAASKRYHELVALLSADAAAATPAELVELLSLTDQRLQCIKIETQERSRVMPKVKILCQT